MDLKKNSHPTFGCRIYAYLILFLVVLCLPVAASCEDGACYSFTGVVQNTMGDGVAGVVVSFALLDGEGDIPDPVMTDDQGRFSQSAFSVGSTYRAEPRKPAWLFAPPRIEFSEETEDAVFIGRPPFSVFGKVTDGASRGAGGATLLFSLVSGTGGVPAAVTTNAEGEFSQEGFTNGAGYRVTPQKDDLTFSPAWRDFSIETAGIPLTFTLVAPYALSGRVLDVSGKPVAGAEIGFSHVAGDGVAPPAVLTDEDGFWTQSGFSYGSQCVATPSKPGYVFDPTYRVAGESGDDLNFTATPPYFVAGRVSDESGQGIEGVEVNFSLKKVFNQEPWGCVAAYDFEGTCDDSLGENDGVGVDVGYVESRAGYSRAVYFYKERSVVNTGNGPDIANLNEFTVAAWVFPLSDGGADAGRIFSKLSAAKGNIGFGVAYERAGCVHLFGRVACESGVAESLSHVASAGVLLNSWHHVAMTWDNATKVVRLYTDGKETSYNYQLRGSGSQKDDSGGDAFIGNWKGGGRRFDGYIDAFRLYNRVLDADQIDRLWSGAGAHEIPASVTTGQDGTWTQSGFWGSCEYEVTASREGWGFSPGSRSFSQTATQIDFLASPPYVISGKITDPSGKGVGGVEVAFRRNYDDGADFAGCIAAYNFEGSADDRIGSNHGTAKDLKYAASTRDGSLAANFCQNGAIVNIGSASKLDNLATFTLAAWVCPRSDGEADAGMIFWKYGPAGGYVRFGTAYERMGMVQLLGGVGCESNRAETLSHVASTGIPLNTWHHVAMTWNNATKVIRLYIDGQETSYNYQVRGSESQMDDAAGDACIGNWKGGGRRFDGYIDDLRIFNRALTATEVQRMIGHANGQEPRPGGVQTNEVGVWSQAGFSGGCRYAATPSKAGWGFTPHARDFSGPSNDVNFVAAPPYVISGRVTDLTGKGVSGVVLKFSARVPGVGVPLLVTTDENGEYVQGGFWGLCEYSVMPWNSGWAFDPAFRHFAGPADDVDFVASPPYSASGKVVDTSGRPVPGITISFSSPDRSGQVPGAVTTGDDGTWLQSGFSGGAEYVAIPGKEGWVFDPVSRRFVGEASDLDFVALPPYSAEGRVTDPSGNGVAGVTITFETDHGWLPEPVVSNAQGYWYQTGFAQGSTYRAIPSKGSWVFDPSLREFSEQAADQNFTGTPPYSVSGRVVDESGQGVGGVTVSFWVRSGSGSRPPPLTTDETGRWSQTGFSMGTDYGVGFKRDGWVFSPSWMSFDGPPGEIQVIGAGPYSVSGKVTDADGNGLPGIKIVFSPRGGARTSPPAVTTAEDGAWSQSGFARGATYWAIPSARGTGFSPAYREFSGPATGLHFVENSPYSISGKVLDEKGDPVPGANIIFSSTRRSRNVPPPVLTGNDGTFAQSDFSPGASYRAIPQKTGWAFAPQQLDFNSSMTDIVFLGRAPFTVSGRVMNRSGQGVGDVQIIFAADDESAYTPEPVTTAGDGRFSQSGFWAGRGYKAIPKKGDAWTFLPGMHQFNDASGALDFEAHEPQATLTVISDHGTPTPPRGESVYAVGSTVSAAVDAMVLEGTETTHTCEGWTGTGSLPATGTEPSFSFVIEDDSSLTWVWNTEFRLEVSASPEELGTIVVPGKEWYEEGSKATISAMPNDGYIFSGWSGDATGRAPTILVEMDQPRTIVAHFTGDSDGDGLPDDWEIQYFGDLSEDGFGDPDQDEAPNSVEYTFDTDPTQPTPKLTVVMSECGANAAIEFPTIKNKVSVLDLDGNSVNGLGSADFVIWEDNVRQLPLDVTESGGEDIVSVALVLDNSGSMAGQPLEDSHQAANVFIDQLKPEDSAAIIKFGTTVSLVQRFTSDKEALHSAVDAPFDGFGDTAFYSAVYRALHESIIRSGSRAVVALTDGVDNASSHGLHQITEYARRVGIPVFVIGLGSVAQDALISLAEGAGGRYYYAPESSRLQAIYDEISRIAGNWYQADYLTTNSDPNAPPYPRAVTVWAHSNGSIGRDDGQYKPPRENTAPLCHVDTPQGHEFSGDVTVTFQLMDFESDICSVEVFYSRDGGWSWHRATLSPDSFVEALSSSPKGEDHSLIWRSAEDMPGVDEDAVRLKIVPYDPKKGSAAETSDFPVRNNARPSVEVDTPVGPQQADVAINYRLVDAENDICSILVEYSVDGGGTWSAAKTAAEGDGEEGLAASPEGTPHVFVWDSLYDMGYKTSDEVRVHITPSDRSEGQAAQTENFTVNNVPPARLSYAPLSFHFVAHEDGENPVAKVLEIWNSGEETLTWQLHPAPGGAWFSVSPHNGQSSGEKNQVTVQVDISGLSVGTYDAEIRIESSDLLGVSSVVPVTLTVEEPLAHVAVSPESLSFWALVSQGDPDAKTLQVRNTGGGDMTWRAWVSAGWLSVTPDTGSSAGETDLLLVTPRVTGLIPGTYQATITIVAPRASNTPQLIPVSLALAESRPQIAVQPERLIFTADEGKDDPPAQTIQIWNAGGLTLPWQAQASEAWISISPTSGTSTGNQNDVSVSVQIAGLTPGTYTTSIIIASEAATNSPVTVPVELTIRTAVVDMAVSPSHLVFTTGKGGPDAPAQKIRISSNGALNWRMDYSAGWLRVNPSEGTVVSGSCQVAVSALKSGLDMGTYQGKITVRSIDHPHTQETVTVTLNIRPIEVPTDHPTIQAGIEAAYDDDIVIVLPGTYQENISVKKNVEVRSSHGMDFTTIDGSGLGTVVSFENVDSARLEGFTIVNGTGSNFGSSSPAGGGIYCIDSSPVISQCRIINNSAAWGGGICADRGSSPKIVDSIIVGNIADDGGGIFCYENASAKFTTTIIAENSAYWFGGGACGIENSSLTFAGSLFYDNIADLSGGGVYATQGCDVQLISCTVADNSSEEGADILAEAGSSVTILNSVIWGEADDLILLGDAIVQYSNVSHPELDNVAGNIMAEPIFFDPRNGDYHLLPDSPCIDSGSNEVSSMPEKDLDGDPRVIAVHDVPITDMGADEHDPEMVFIQVTEKIVVAPDLMVTVPYMLWSSRSISCPVTAEYSEDDGRTWHPATPAASGDAPAGVVSSPSGQQHTFVWDAPADIGSDSQQEVRLRLKADVPKASRPAVTEPFFLNVGD